MGLSARDKQDFKEGIHTIYNILGSNNILYLPLDTSKKPSIYAEKKGMSYLEPIPLTGKYNTSESEFHANSSVTMKPESALNVFIPLLEIELKHLDPQEMTKGQFEINGVRYSITLCNQSGLFADMPVGYSFSCKGVDFI